MPLSAAGKGDEFLERIKEPHYLGIDLIEQAVDRTLERTRPGWVAEALGKLLRTEIAYLADIRRGTRLMLHHVDFEMGKATGQPQLTTTGEAGRRSLGIRVDYRLGGSEVTKSRTFFIADLVGISRHPTAGVGVNWDLRGSLAYRGDRQDDIGPYYQYVTDQGNPVTGIATEWPGFSRLGPKDEFHRSSILSASPSAVQP